MTRSLVLIPMLVAACSVGEYGESSGGDAMGGDDRNRCVQPVATPAAAYVHTANGGDATPRAGQSCIAAGCHAAGQAGGEFAIAGTIYKDLNGTQPQPGVTVRIFPVGGNKSVASVVTDSAGNFIFRGNYKAFPYITDVTGCGKDSVAVGIRPMIGSINAADISCNKAGCHIAPGSMPAYLLD